MIYKYLVYTKKITYWQYMIFFLFTLFGLSVYGFKYLGDYQNRYLYLGLLLFLLRLLVYWLYTSFTKEPVLDHSGFFRVLFFSTGEGRKWFISEIQSLGLKHLGDNNYPCRKVIEGIIRFSISPILLTLTFWGLCWHFFLQAYNPFLVWLIISFFFATWYFIWASADLKDFGKSMAGGMVYGLPLLLEQSLWITLIGFSFYQFAQLFILTTEHEKVRTVIRSLVGLPDRRV